MSRPFQPTRPDDPDATVVRRPLPDPEATVVRRAPNDADATVVRAFAAAPPRVAVAAGAEAPPLPPGFRLHEYRIERVLGRGGFGVTYLATDVHLDAPVAVKEYLPQQIACRDGDRSVRPSAAAHRERYRQGLEAFLAEARTLAGFRHPAIVRVARFFEAHRTAYMVLEYERGSALKAWWPAQPPLREAALLALLAPLLDGLAVVHAAGFLHRDIKPDNIQVREDDGRLVLLDFGSAGRVLAGGGDEVALTPGYAPPEQYGAGEQGPWTDLYAFGATLYWLVTGRRPPDAEARRLGVAPLAPAVEAARGRYGERFLAAIDWALQLRPQDRPRDVEQWRHALFADHAASLRIDEALRAGRGGSRPARQRWLRRLQPARWPLAVKMALAMAATALLPMALTAAWNLEGSLDALGASELRNVELIAHATAGRLGQLALDSRRLAAVLATDLQLTGHLLQPAEAERAALHARLQAVVQANPDIQLVMLMDARGTAVVSSDPEVMGRNFGFREYFREAMAGRPYASGIVVGAVAGQAGVFYAVPVRGDDGAPAGALVLRMRGAAFAAVLDEVRAQSALTPFLVDGDGIVVHHPREDLLYRSLVPLAEARQAELRADQRFRREHIASLDEPALAQAMVGAAQVGHVAYRSRLSGRDEIAGYAPVPGHDWVVGVGELRERFEAPLHALYTHLLWSVALVGLLFTGLALRFARGIVRPIRALTGSVRALERGDFDGAIVPVTRRDEIGRLARAFNVMIDVLRQREAERGRRPAP